MTALPEPLMHEDRRVAVQAQAQCGLVVLGDRAAGKDFEFAIADRRERFATERAADGLLVAGDRARRRIRFPDG